MTAVHGTHDDLMWLVGLLEGEVCIDIHRGRYPRLRLGMTDRDVVGRAATLMGSRVRLSLHPAPNKPTWHTEISGPRAAAIMRAILPYMGARRSQKIAEVLAVVEFSTVERTSAPGPRIARPAGITKPVTAT